LAGMQRRGGDPRDFGTSANRLKLFACFADVRRGVVSTGAPCKTGEEMRTRIRSIRTALVAAALSSLIAVPTVAAALPTTAVLATRLPH
jgi:hypothetical protein